MIDRHALVLGFAALCGCAGAPLAPSPASAAPPALGASASAAVASAPAAPTDADLPSSPLCAPILAHNVTLLEEGGHLDEAWKAPCFPTKGGAWALRLDA